MSEQSDIQDRWETALWEGTFGCTVPKKTKPQGFLELCTFFLSDTPPKTETKKTKNNPTCTKMFLYQVAETQVTPAFPLVEAETAAAY